MAVEDRLQFIHQAKFPTFENFPKLHLDQSSLHLWLTFDVVLWGRWEYGVTYGPSVGPQIRFPKLRLESESIQSRANVLPWGSDQLRIQLAPGVLSLPGLRDHEIPKSRDQGCCAWGKFQTSIENDWWENWRSFSNPASFTMPIMLSRALKPNSALRITRACLPTSLAKRRVTTDAASSHADRENVPTVRGEFRFPCHCPIFAHVDRKPLGRW